MDPKEERLLQALREIAKGEGRFSRDPLTHAANTIEDMKSIALDAIKDYEEQSDEHLEKETP